MKVSLNWLKELVDLKVSRQELIKLIPLRTVGTKEVNDRFLELDMKGYNRADLLSMRGVALEVAAITDSEIKFKDIDKQYVWLEQKSLKPLEVRVENPEFALVYCLVKIENLKIGSSPKEWVEKLEDSGMRSINNLADITNLVMLEYGQPLHAFDAKDVKNEAVIVRTAIEGEEIETLDAKKRKLESTDLLIADEDKALGIAGIMGGKNSEVTNQTTTILLEAAIFDPANLRKTSMRLGLVSEASKRFYHGLTPTRLYQALDAAIKMYQGLGGKLTATFIQTSDNLSHNLNRTREIDLRQSKLDSLIGVRINPEDVENYLRKLKCEVKPVPRNKQDKSWLVTPPYYRLDLNIEEDLVEEVARMYGYENIPANDLPRKAPARIDQALFENISKLREFFVKEGLTEVQTYSFYSTLVYKSLGFEGESLKLLVKVSNPISSETEYLRQNLWPNSIEVIGKNLKQRTEDIAIFEIGKVYSPIEDGLPKESYRVALAICDGTGNELLEINKILEDLNKEFNLNLKVKDSTPQGETINLFHPARFFTIEKDGKQVGIMSEVHPRSTLNFGIEKRVGVIEIDLINL